MAKSNKVYNKQYKDINNVEARITRTDNDHTSLKDANLMLDVRIPVKNRKLTLNDVVDMMLDGFNKINARLDKHEEILNKHTEILARHEQILNRHSEILNTHSEIFARNNLA